MTLVIHEPAKVSKVAKILDLKSQTVPLRDSAPPAYMYMYSE